MNQDSIVWCASCTHTAQGYNERSRTDGQGKLQKLLFLGAWPLRLGLGITTLRRRVIVSIPS